MEMRNQGQRRRAGRIAAVLLMAAALGGCELLYFLGGKGQQPALFDLPKGKRVLVLVDVPANTEAPPTFATTLATHISDHIYRNEGADHLVGQERLEELRATKSHSGKWGSRI